MDTHGNFNITIYESLIEISIDESWNVECVQQAIAEFKRLASTLKPNWACLVNLDNWALATPETEPLVQNFQQWCINHGQKIEAIVVGDSIPETKTFQMQKFMRGTEQSIEQAYFSNRQQAVQWLNTKGISVKQAPKLLGDV